MMPSLKNLFLMIVVLGGILACQNDASKSNNRNLTETNQEFERVDAKKPIDKALEHQKPTSGSIGKDTTGIVDASLDSIRYEEEAPIPKKNTPVKEKVKKIKSKVKSIKKPVVKKKKKKVNKGSISFYNTVHNYGRIEMGEKVDYTFQFINNGKGPLNILEVDVSCGCTTPTYPFIPIEPGKMGKIQVHFDSDNRLGPQESTITVKTDGEVGEVVLTLEGEVITDIAQPLDSL